MMLGYAFDDVHSHLVMNDAGTDALDAIAPAEGQSGGAADDGDRRDICRSSARCMARRGISTFRSSKKNPTRAVLHIDGQPPVEIEQPFEINGFEYEIREAQACARAGKGQSERLTGEPSP